MGRAYTARSPHFFHAETRPEILFFSVFSPVLVRENALKMTKFTYLQFKTPVVSNLLWRCATCEMV